MMRNLFATLLLAGLGTTASAGSCPILIKDIDAALNDPAAVEHLSDQQLKEVRALRKQGAKAHQSGDHGQSMEVLTRARELLGIS